MTAHPHYKKSESWEETYPDNWRKFKTERRLFWIMLLMMPVFVVAMALLLPILSAYVLITMPIYFIAWIWLGRHVDGWRCPRCHERFIRGVPYWVGPFGSMFFGLMDWLRPKPFLPRNMEPTAREALIRQYQQRRPGAVCHNCDLSITPLKQLKDHSHYLKKPE